MALALNGVNGRVDFPAGIDPVGSGQSICLRYNPSALGVSEYLHLMENGATGIGGVFWISDAGGGAQRLTFTCFGSTALSVSTVAVGFSIGSWYDIILTWDGTTLASGVHIYVDGVDLSFVNNENGAALVAQNGNRIIGGRASDNNRNLTGRIADVGEFPGVVLTAPQQALFNQGLPPAQLGVAVGFDARFLSGSLVDAVSAASGTAVGSPVAYQHPTAIVASTQSAPMASQSATATNDSAVTTTRHVSAAQIAPMATQSATADYTAPPGPGITVLESFECNNINPSACTIGGTATDPTLAVVPYKGIGNVVRSYYGRITGLAGKTLTITVPNAGMSYGFISTQPLFWRPIGGGTHFGPGGWQLWSSINATSGSIVASHTFAVDGIEWSEQAFITPTQKAAAWAARIATSPHVRSVDPSNPTTGRFNLLPETTGHNGFVIPAMYQHGVGIGSGPALFIHIGQQHPNEATGAVQLEAFQDRLIDGSPSMEALLAASTHYVLEGNPQGLFGGGQDANTFDPNDPTKNCNRDWGVGALGCVQAIMDLIANEIGHTGIICLIDWHNRLSGVAGQESAIFMNPAWSYVSRFRAEFNAAYPHTDYTQVTILPDGNVCQNYYHALLDPEILTVTMEPAQGTPPATHPGYQDGGVAVADALAAMMTAGVFDIHFATAAQSAPMAMQSGALVGTAPARNAVVMQSAPMALQGAVMAGDALISVVTPSSRRAQAIGFSRRAQAEIDSRTK